MPIKLRDRDALPIRDRKTVHALGLDIPLTGDIPLGAQVEMMDLQADLAEKKIGKWEFTLRAFCLLTRRMPKRDWITYDQVSEEIRHPEDQAEVLQAVNKLIFGLMEDKAEADADDGSGDTGNAPKAKGKAK